MGTYECAKCGETMSSKNPAIRSVFPTDQLASMMTNIVNVVTTKNEDGKRTVTFEFPFSDTLSQEHRNDDQLEMTCARIIQQLTNDELKHWLCNHKWELIAGEVLAG